MNYNTVQLQQNVLTLLPTLNSEKLIDKTVVRAVKQGEGKILCLNASGGTGQTYTINDILDCLQSQSKIALATAIPDIAASLLNNG